MGNGMLSQEEIDALLGGNLESGPPIEEQPTQEFSDMEKDAIGEIANISMGTAATTLSQLLMRKVEITTPKVDLADSDQIRKDYPIPSIIVDVRYKVGIEGSNLLILSQRDGAVIVDLMMGGNGQNPSEELNEISISGVAEAMNQMMGSAATSMSTMFNSVIDITPPQLVLNDMSGQDTNAINNFLNTQEKLVRISFRMVVEDVIDSILVQVIPIPVAKGMVEKLLGSMGGTSSKQETKPTPPPPAPVQAPTASYGQPVQHPPEQPPQVAYAPQPEYPQQGYGGPAYGHAPGGQYAGGYGAPPTTVQPAQFVPLKPAELIQGQDNLGLILDVPLQVSVELGKAKKTIKEILELGPGSVIELDRLAGEPVDMIVNGKLVAKCEVVVINETFGIRITDIVQPSERMTKAMGL
ncbi:CheC, inhibitor of MCP methylation [Desulfitobacterium dichloroeliminans LMG P-21439]|uniref:CheC, inhibitor of MCP methylation n=1 Tax=Desulfitobacterium dichloroeliminans (strain LMG P-21439 / DCA1) TaxID=871963 RepID=L0FC95_DESDL|nr:flagellar motor switch phosphatase FliY [Desulfitobacterium dichloroeliminans]AGA70276.1 CheC, inhibitor of MCP methylation [Desulfitobacterium dichloroeliminans LMG P-21439]